MEGEELREILRTVPPEAPGPAAEPVPSPAFKA